MILQAEHATTRLPPSDAFWGSSPALASFFLLPKKHHVVLGALGPGTEQGSGARSLLG